MSTADPSTEPSEHPRHPMLPHLIDLERPYSASEHRGYDAVELVRFALTASDYWADLALSWLEQGVPANDLQADLAALEGQSHRPQALRHRAWRLAKAAAGQEARARTGFGDLLALHDLGGSPRTELVDVAASLLAAGVDGAGVVELASLSVTPLTSPFELDALIEAARDELCMPRLDRDATQLRAAQGQIWSWKAGRLTDRGLTQWAHTSIGHEGCAELQDLVVADDELDLAESGFTTPEALHANLVAIADTCLDYSDPWSAG